MTSRGKAGMLLNTLRNKTAPHLTSTVSRVVLSFPALPSLGCDVTIKYGSSLFYRAFRPQVEPLGLTSTCSRVKISEGFLSSELNVSGNRIFILGRRGPFV